MATYYTYGQDNPSQVAADAPKDGPTVYEYRPPQNPGGAPAGQPYSYCDVRYIWSDQPLKMPECYPLYNGAQVPAAYPPHLMKEFKTNEVYMYYTQPIAYVNPAMPQAPYASMNMITPASASVPGPYYYPVPAKQPVPWYGPTCAQVDAQNAAIIANQSPPVFRPAIDPQTGAPYNVNVGVGVGVHGATAGVACAFAGTHPAQMAPVPGVPGGIPMPVAAAPAPGFASYGPQVQSPMVPFENKPGQQWWCREIDGSYTLRTINDLMENCRPGEWKRHPQTGVPYWVRA